MPSSDSEERLEIGDGGLALILDDFVSLEKTLSLREGPNFQMRFHLGDGVYRDCMCGGAP